MGALVKAGDVIAIIGNSGRLSAGPHLHFELGTKEKQLIPNTIFYFNDDQVILGKKLARYVSQTQKW